MANIGWAQSATNLTATGTSQSGAFALVAENNYFSTVAASTGAVLDSNLGEGQVQMVYNGGANQLSVYPPSSAQINSLGTNNAMLLPTQTSCDFIRLGPTQWTGILSR